ncbi:MULTISPECIES: hypothetical protein [unclassified Acinetobacter]|uniref:hypothetical protein n=1 Tax=unclassified Acinetobacter TaxID=196816 RepID=UPI002934DF4E|nr:MULTISPECIES: hypothetical protein [unclassified Acinetobacter]WOE31123.1 hypothetical protein QSG84_12350 [Acinetobacter sp. SAAs470]WOE39319.1 hypothetical protein QSG86_06015 [Acinetobacter sp. SAAs474]
MLKKFILGAALSSFLITTTVNASSDYNIAKGLTPVAQGQSIRELKPFNGNFRILSTKIYTDDEQAKFSPIDYAVSSGLFAQPQIAKQIHVKQYDRYLNWKMDYVPVPTQQALEMVSNMHIIPANPEIAKQITQVQRGDLVHLTGSLVEVKDRDLVWTSSLNPADTGDGACEVFKVESIQWLEKKQLS